jgi:hypothetical protein
LGITKAQTIYTNIPVPNNNTDRAQSMRIIEASKSKYSARPPHTPAITLLVFDLYNFFSMISPPAIMIVIIMRHLDVLVIKNQINFFILFLIASLACIT